eukprot:c28412_g1_i3 orf=63-329(-)
MDSNTNQSCFTSQPKESNIFYCKAPSLFLINLVQPSLNKSINLLLSGLHMLELSISDFSNNHWAKRIDHLALVPVKSMPQRCLKAWKT